MRRGESKTSQRRLCAASKQLAALQMRKAGHTYSEIAIKLGYRSRSGAFFALRRGLGHAVIARAKDELLTLELERLNALTLAIYQRAIAGDLGALNAYLLILDQRAALLGLDASRKRAK
ncbi:hypothetical protein [Massilia litorea]|uniref:Uncharacterized protein n=1 Tax=Massilia litorea TaxID=2769491 RepID=A0A7L9U4C7_9BURK|nr:hypothetical protein [Massilia litorea]QOL49730.1 hypothetical protein LPB04_23135 [Massilia litorea]